MLEEREQDGKEQGISQATVRNFMILVEFSYYPDQSLGVCAII